MLMLMVMYINVSLIIKVTTFVRMKISTLRVKSNFIIDYFQEKSVIYMGIIS